MAEPIKLFQYNTLGALMAGLYDGSMTVGELLQYGDLGLGTLDSIDGELIILDGKAYQAKGSGEVPEVVEVSPDMTVPYAAVVPHQRRSFSVSVLRWMTRSWKSGLSLTMMAKIFSALSRFMAISPACMFG